MASDEKDLSSPGGGPKAPIKDTLRRPLPRRFYESVAIASAQTSELEGFQILLDGRPVRTPAKRLLVIPDADFADCVAAEWRAQQGVIDPAIMPATRLANSALDCVAQADEDVRAEIVAYAGSDLLCYRAERPEGLVRRQQELWDPILVRIEAHLSTRFVRVSGLIHHPQPEAALRKIAEAVATVSIFPLSALSLVTTLTGSALLALSGLRGLATREQIWAAAHADEDWQIAQWGEDAEAAARRDVLRRDFEAACALLRVKTSSTR
jgi:chaperone required for assembly of F1-ATPase